MYKKQSTLQFTLTTLVLQLPSCGHSGCEDNASLPDGRTSLRSGAAKVLFFLPNTKKAIVTAARPASTANQYWFNRQNPNGNAKLMIYTQMANLTWLRG